MAMILWICYIVALGSGVILLTWLADCCFKFDEYGKWEGIRVGSLNEGWFGFYFWPYSSFSVTLRLGSCRVWVGDEIST